MRLSWNEVRGQRGAAFAATRLDAGYEREETQSIYLDFVAEFGVNRRLVARYEQHVAGA